MVRETEKVDTGQRREIRRKRWRGGI